MGRALRILLVLCAGLQGCATQLELELPRAEAGDAAVVSPALRFQDLSAAPDGQDAFVGTDALRPGDILLTSMPGVAARGIELLTIAPVSHAAIYVGDGRIVEAVRSGVGERSMHEVLEDETIALVLRDPELRPQHVERIRAYARKKTGAGFNFVGVTLQIPYSLGRRLCELPLVPGVARDGCLRTLGVFNRLASRENRMFCSQFVLQAYRYAGAPLTDADPRIVSPGDILHMREGDVPSIRIRKPLRYVGHLKYSRPMLAAAER